MDCEKFDLCVMDALYDELDELTSAAIRRHAEGCSRCSGVFNGLRATREVGILPIVDPPADLEERILEAAFTAQKRTPLRRKVLRGLAWAGSHAMRPQLAMAALFFLVIGSSLLLLKSRPGGGALRVTERGAPGPEEPIAAEAQPTAAPAAAAAEATAAPSDLQQKAKPSEEEKLAKEKDKDKSGDAKAALVEARATRERSGCAAAVGKFDEVGARFPATNAAADAMWEEASCYKSLGEAAKQRELLLALKANPQYKERVDVELDSGQMASGNSMQQAARASHARAAPAAAAPQPQAVAQQAPPEAAPPPPARPSASPSANMGSAGKAVAAPKKSTDNASGF